MRVILGFVLLIGVLGDARETLAATGPECGFFEYQEHAQEALDKVAIGFPTLLEMYQDSLDSDRDGIACPELPSMPTVLASTYDIRGSFDTSTFDDIDVPVIIGFGYSARYFVHLAGVSLDSADSHQSACGDLLTTDNLNLAINAEGTVSSMYYITQANGDPPPPDDADERHEMTGLVWTISGDTQTPVLVNEWLLAQGLGTLDTGTVPADLEDLFRAAEVRAQEQAIGVWGSCTVPLSLKDSEPTVTNAYEHLFRESGEGNQVLPFAIESEGVYQVTLDVTSGTAVFVALDVYSVDGTWVPELGIITGENGQFSSAAHLQPGEYYAQVKAVGSWRVTIDPLDSAQEY